ISGGDEDGGFKVKTLTGLIEEKTVQVDSDGHDTLWNNLVPKPAECKASEGSEDPLSAKHQLVIKGLADGKASASNLRDIQVKDIVKEVKDYLKIYSSDNMDIRCSIRASNPTDTINNTTTTNVVQNVVDENLPSLFDSIGGSHVINVPEFDEEDFLSWKDRFLIYLDGLEPYLLGIHENGPLVPLSPLSTPTNPLPKPHNQWSHADRRLANQDKRLKCIIISCLPTNGPSESKDTKIAALRLKFNSFKALEGEKVNGTFPRPRSLLNDLENNGVSISQAEVNATLVNSLPRKWLKSTRFSIHGSKALISNLTMQDSDSAIEEDQRSSSEFLANLNAEFHERALLANQKRFYKRSGRVGSSKKPLDKSNETCFACGKLGHFQKEFLTKKNDAMNKGKRDKGLVAESFDWDEESVPFDNEVVTIFKALMAVVDELSIGMADARSSTLGVTYVVALLIRPLTVLLCHQKGIQGLHLNDPLKNDSVQEKQDADKDENAEKEKVETEKEKQDKADKVDNILEKQDDDKDKIGEDEF
nr:hypothetical protein [Tanacetum cinerariifolium]